MLYFYTFIIWYFILSKAIIADFMKLNWMLFFILTRELRWEQENSVSLNTADVDFTLGFFLFYLKGGLSRGYTIWA